MNTAFSQSRLIAWMMWMIASIFYAYQYVLRVMPNIMLDDILKQFHINAATFGQFSGFYYISYSLMHIPIGLMLDRFGPRKIMTGSILLTVIGLTPLIFAEHWVYPILGRFLIGMGSSAAILGVFKIVRMVFSERRFQRMLSFSVTIGLIGAIYGGGPVSYLCNVFGYQMVVKIFACAGVALACITYWLIPKMEKTENTTSVLSDIKEVLMNPRVVWTCVFAGLMVGPLEGFADVWGSAFLKQVYGFEGTVAASLPSMIFLGMCFGGPLLSVVSERSRNPIFTIISAGLLMSCSFFALLIWHLSSSVITMSFIIIGICSAYQILAIYKASTYVPERVAGLTTAVANMIIMIFGYAFHSIIGTIVNAMGGTHSPHALISGIIVIPLALLIGSIGFTLLLLKEPRTARQLP